MTSLLKLPAYLQPYRFIIRFGLLFTAFHFVFLAWYGVVTPGGATYSAFLDNYLDIIEVQTNFITTAAGYVLKAFYSDVRQLGNTLRVGTSSRVAINISCLGFGVLSFWMSLVIANNGNWKYKLKWVLVGLVSITLLNIIRIAFIAAALHERWKTVEHMDHHLMFNIASYILLFVLFFVYTSKSKKEERSSVTTKMATG